MCVEDGLLEQFESDIHFVETLDHRSVEVPALGIQWVGQTELLQEHLHLESEVAELQYALLMSVTVKRVGEHAAR
jgi:hypothetical protein